MRVERLLKLPDQGMPPAQMIPERTPYTQTADLIAVLMDNCLARVEDEIV